MKARWTITLAALGALGFACGSSDGSGLDNTGGSNSGGASSGGASSGGTGGSATGGASGSGTGGSATGGTAGAATGGTAGAATGGAAGSPGKNCQTLESDYTAALEAAKVCGGLDPIAPCTKLMPTELACPCETFVSESNTEAIKQLEHLKDQWDKQDCGLNVACPEIACPQPASAICSTSGGKGSHCQDVSVGAN